MEFRIALYPGDGIGPDVLQEAVRVMQRIGEIYGITFHTTSLDWGMSYWQQHGQLVPDDFLEQLDRKSTRLNSSH